MMKFLKPFDEVKTKPASAGTIYEVTYQQRYDKNGTPYLVEDNHRNFREIVRSHKDECNYKKIISRYMSTGDITLLQRSKGAYMDLKDYPRDFVDAYDKIKRAERIFNGLDKDTRTYYGNDVVKFLADFGSEKWCKAFGLGDDVVIASSPNAIKESEEAKNASTAE